MLPPWLLTAFYVVSGVAIVWLLLRIAEKRRMSRLEQDWPAQPTRTAASPPATVTPAQAATSALPPRPSETAPTPPSEVTILRATAQGARAEAQTAAATPNPPAAAAASSTRSGAPTWERTQLFGDIRQTETVDRLLPGDLPTARTDDYVFGGATPMLASLLPDSATRAETARQELLSAGYFEPHATQNFAAVRYLLMMLGLITALLILLVVPRRVEWIAIGGLVALPLLGWALPRLYVRGQAADRRSEIERGMPDLLDMLNMCVSQGLTIPDSLRRIIRDLRGAYPALAQEMRIVSEQAAIGNMPQALDNFSRRMDVPEVHSFTSLLTQTERMGTSISEALTSYSDTMRESLRQRADEKGNRATFQLLFPTVLCLMPAVYLFLLGPAIIDLSNFFNSGGRDSLDRGTQVIQRINTNRQAGR